MDRVPAKIRATKRAAERSFIGFDFFEKSRDLVPGIKRYQKSRNSLNFSIGYSDTL